MHFNFVWQFVFSSLQGSCKLIFLKSCNWPCSRGIEHWHHIHLHPHPNHDHYHCHHLHLHPNHDHYHCCHPPHHNQYHHHRHKAENLAIDTIAKNGTCNCAPAVPVCRRLKLDALCKCAMCTMHHICTVCMSKHANLMCNVQCQVCTLTAVSNILHWGLYCDRNVVWCSMCKIQCAVCIVVLHNFHSAVCVLCALLSCVQQLN